MTRDELSVNKVLQDICHCLYQAGCRSHNAEMLKTRICKGKWFRDSGVLFCLDDQPARIVIQLGTITGKLNGVMPATTPSGWRSE